MAKHNYREVYQALYPLKKHVRCAQARHFLVCCWLVMAWMRDPGTGTRKGLHAYLPSTLQYWTTLRMLRSGQWEAAATRRTLPPPADGVRSLIGESTLQDKRGRQHPLGPTTRHRAHDPSTFGVEMVLRMVRWGRYRVPVALATIAPHSTGPQHILFRPRLKDCGPPAWPRQVVVVAAAGCAANETLRLITEHN